MTGENTPSGNRQRTRPFRASSAYVPRSPAFVYRDAFRPHRGQAAKYTRPFITVGAPWIADDAEKRQTRSPVAASNAWKKPS